MSRISQLTALARIFLLALAFILASPLAANAQFIPSTATSDAQSPDAMQKVLEEASRDGSTIIMISPKDAGNSARDSDDSMGAERFLEARARIRSVMGSWHTLPETMTATLQKAGPAEGLRWIIPSIVTAIAGLLLAKLITTPVQRWTRDHFSYMYRPDPRTAADKFRYLLFRALLAVVYAGIFFGTMIAVALVFDPQIEASRRLIFEIALGYATYRLLRYAVSWNLFAPDVGSHRLVNLTDDEAQSIHRGWIIAVVAGIIVAVVGRFFVFTALDLQGKGVTDILTADHLDLIQVMVAAFAILVTVVFTLATWKQWTKAFAPPDPDTPFQQFLSGLLRLTPIVWLLYSFFAFGMFIFQLALGRPAPAAVIAAPYLVLWIGGVVYGLILILIQFFYDRREKRFAARVAEERARMARDEETQEAALDHESGEEMMTPGRPSPFEFQPAFRAFFEHSALAIVVAFGVGELLRVWGIHPETDKNMVTAALNIGLASILCWLAYRAVAAFIDRKLEEEGGVPTSEDEEMGGEGGGAGATRMATLLPILRYILVFAIISIAVMVFLSSLGFDIGPIFAGAGVVGIAVGFGAQTLIRDIFSGAFFLLDDAFRKGEYVEIGATKGVVEKISVRSFQLRHHLGALHTIPFGEITQLTNYSRDWVMMKLPLRVTYDTDVEKVRKLVKKLGQRLLEHPQVGHTFLQPLKSQGVYKMEDSAMIIRVKFMTRPGEQFVTRKVVYESIQDLFAREGIKFAHKEVTVRLADGERVEDLTPEQKEAATAAARSIVDQEEEAAQAAGKGQSGGSDR